METFNIATILDQFYPEVEYTFDDTKKGYDHTAYTATVGTMPTLDELRVHWDSIKRETDLYVRFIAKRDELLKESDMYATVDYPHADEATKQAWLDYRQALRDLPENTWPIWDNNGQMSATFPDKP